MNQGQQLVKAEVISHTQVHPTLWKLEVLAMQGPCFQAGQYVSWFIDGERHGPFSVASAPEHLPVMTFYSRNPFSKISPKMQLEIGESRGYMLASDPTKHYIFCAGGTGVTPFVSLIQSSKMKDIPYTLLWSMTEQADKIMLPSANPSVFYHDYISDEPYVGLLQPYLLEHKNCFYIAGPMVFVRLVAQYLLDHHVDPDRILSDMLDIRRFAAGSLPSK